MTQSPRRLPGEPNPTASPDAAGDVARQSLMSNGHGDGGHGIVSAVSALLAWVRRRRADVDDDPARERRRLAEMLAIYEALALAMERRREVFDLVGESMDPDHALGQLQRTLGIDEVQARAVLDAQLRRFTARDRSRITEERDRLRQMTEGS